MSIPTWPQQTELIGLKFELIPQHNRIIQPRYQASLHAWFLHQVQHQDPALSAHLHDNQEEKSFTLSGLQGSFSPRGRQMEVVANQPYHWQISALTLIQPTVGMVGDS